MPHVPSNTCHVQNGLELFITKVDPKKAEASMNLERDDSKESDANASPLNIANAGIGNDLDISHFHLISKKDQFKIVFAI